MKLSPHGTRCLATLFPPPSLHPSPQQPLRTVCLTVCLRAAPVYSTLYTHPSSSSSSTPPSLLLSFTGFSGIILPGLIRNIGTPCLGTPSDRLSIQQHDWRSYTGIRKPCFLVFDHGSIRGSLLQCNTIPSFPTGSREYSFVLEATGETSWWIKSLVTDGLEEFFVF